MVTLRVAFNSSMSKWMPVMNRIPQGSVLDPPLFNIFVSNKDIGTECTFSKLANISISSCAVVFAKLEGRDAMQIQDGPL